MFGFMLALGTGRAGGRRIWSAGVYPACSVSGRCKQNFHVYIFVLVLPISRVVCGPFIDFSVLIARD